MCVERWKMEIGKWYESVYCLTSEIVLSFRNPTREDKEGSSNEAVKAVAMLKVVEVRVERAIVCAALSTIPPDVCM